MIIEIDVRRVIVRFLALLILLFGIMFLWQLPSDTYSAPTDSLSSELQALDDDDLRTRAKSLWDKNDRLSALALLEQIVINDLPDRPLAEADLREYNEIMKQEKTFLGTLYRGSRGFLLGRSDTLAGLGGVVLSPTFPENHLFEGKNRFFFSGKYDESSIISLKIADVVT